MTGLRRWLLGGLMLAGMVTAHADTIPTIGIIGAGQMGGTLATLWSHAGYPVILSSRHPDQLKAQVTELGRQTRAASPQQAAEKATVVVLAVPYGALPSLAKSLGNELKGKVVLDVTNPYPGRDGSVAEQAISQGVGLYSSRLFPEARLVRGFNSIAAATLSSEAHRSGEKLAVPLAGDDPQALKQVSSLVTAAGFDPLVVGGLDKARLFQPGSSLFLSSLTRQQLQQQISSQQ